MREIDLKNINIRTDLIVDLIKEKEKHNLKTIDNIKISNVTITKEEAKNIGKKEGIYTTIFFDDVTDNTNYQQVKQIFKKELSKILEEEHITNDHQVLIIGLGNIKSTPDALGPKTIEGILVTKHLYEITGTLEKGYRVVSAISPGVTGITGIETYSLIEQIVKIVKPNLIICIDALASSSLERLNKTIQITNTGITPGSALGTKRKEITKEQLNIPVIAIGIPTVVGASTIVSDTINYMYQKISYNIKNINNNKNKLIPDKNINYLEEETNLDKSNKNELLGLIGTLNEEETKDLINEVLNPIGYNLMVTPKEVDFLIDKLSILLSSSINELLHRQNN